MRIRIADRQCARLNWRDRVRHSCSRGCFARHSLAPQEINAAIMGGPKQPRLQRPALVELFQLPISLDQGLLHDVLAVHDRTRRDTQPERRREREKAFAIMMDPDPYVTVSGPVDARYLALLETVSTLRPSLHRYCGRMIRAPCV